MRLVSFDVGIKNLAYCVFDFATKTQWTIPEWTCVNLLAVDSSISTPKPCCHLIKGKTKTASDHPCGKKSKWVVPDNGAASYCELHAKMHNEWIIPTKRHTTAHINKLKLAELEQEYSAVFGAFAAGIPLKKMKKSELVESITKYYESKCFQSTAGPKAKTAGEIDLVTIGRAIRRQLDGDPSIEGATHVVIENQISTIATRMKTIQGMIAQYFIMRFGDGVHIEFVSSHNKLKGFSDATATKEVISNVLDASSVDVTEAKKTKSTYKANKSDGITICRTFFDSNPEEMGKWLPIFDKSPKRDDLADCFLQGIWYLGYRYAVTELATE
jgi:hypothetical protein